MSTASARLESPVLARAAVESLLRARKLDRTLTSSRPDIARRILGCRSTSSRSTPISTAGCRPGSSPRWWGRRRRAAPRWCGGGWRRPRVGATRWRSSTPSTASIRSRRRRAASISIACCGFAARPSPRPAGRWIRCGCPACARWKGPARWWSARVDRALKALNLVLQSGVCPVVVIDMADVPQTALRRIPYTTWLRVQRVIEGSDTTCVLLAPEPLARSAGGVTLTMQAPGAARRRSSPVRRAGRWRRPRSPRTWRWRGEGPRARRFDGLRFDVRVSSSRRQAAGRVSLSADAARRSALGRAVTREPASCSPRSIPCRRRWPRSPAWRSRSRRASR